MNESNIDSSIKKSQSITIQDAYKFVEILDRSHNKGVVYVLSNVLKYLLDMNQETSPLVNFMNSTYLYRWFLKLINFNFSKTSLDQLDSINLALTFFEMSLYNQLVIANFKSNVVIPHRQKFYEYFKNKEQLIEYEFKTIPESN